MGTPANAAGYSALAYYFGEKIDSALNIPVGVVVSSFVNTGCEAWTATETITGNPILNANYINGPYRSQCYNAMIYPLQNLSIKGIIWDQGENNEHDE